MELIGAVDGTGVQFRREQVEVERLSERSLDGYLLRECLGHSSHTAVYRATTSAGGYWAVKVVDERLAPDDRLLERLRWEAQVLAQSASSAIVLNEHVERSGGLTLAASPLVRGWTLQEMMARGRLDTELAWQVVSQIADALDSAHQGGVAYRGLKPGNILVQEQGRVRLTEFGVVSNEVGPLALSTPTYRLSQPQYLAPEQVQGREPDSRADVYAFGVLVFELLTGAWLHHHERAAVTLQATLHGPGPSAVGLAPGLVRAVDAVLGRALSRDPRKRQRSAWELLDELVSLPEDTGPPRSVPAASDGDGSHAGRGEPALALLQQMGVPKLEARETMLLNSFFATVLQFGAQAAQSRWPDVLFAAGLSEYLGEVPADAGGRTATVESCSRLAEGFERVFGGDAVDVTHRWGQLTMDHWLKTTQKQPFRMMGRPEQKVADGLYVFTRSLDRVRGERLHVWKQVDKNQFWLVHYANLFAVGRCKQARACHFWVAALQSVLRWGGLANDWVVEEIECGCVTGTGACVLMISRAGA